MKRMSISALILCACFADVARGQQPACRFSPFWAEFHKHNMMRWNRCENVISVRNVGSLVLKWSYANGPHPVASSPAVANGVVYVGSDDDNVDALKASTGALLWSYATGNEVGSSPAVSNGVVYVGGGSVMYAFGLK